MLGTGRKPPKIYIYFYIYFLNIYIYIFNLEKTNYEKKLIREVKLENGDRVSEPKQIEKEL